MGLEVVLAENSWLGLLAWLPARVSLEDRLWGSLASPVRLSRWSGRGYSVGWASNWALCGSQVVGQALGLHGSVFGTQIKCDYTLNSLASQGP